MLENFFEKLKNKLKVKKLDKNQPRGIWIFVVSLNLIGFIGYYVIRNIQ